MTRSSIPRFLVVAMCVLLVASCGGETKSGVEFGEGELPGDWPQAFPIPENAVIGSTLVNHDSGRQEVEFRVSAPIETLAQYFDLNLANAGYAIDSSNGNDTTWSIEFRDDDDSGSIVIQSFGNISSAVVRILGEG
ncbi:MAG: hypothetical protein KJN71_03345 [Acidimicrobiia bacterium]|nr:hypothetical protein [Acidimicrobiia bacterium]NNC75743.1 hypothetical protein [Acidimicrobiia bacterium]